MGRCNASSFSCHSELVRAFSSRHHDATLPSLCCHVDSLLKPTMVYVCTPRPLMTVRLFFVILAVTETCFSLMVSPLKSLGGATSRVAPSSGCYATAPTRQDVDVDNVSKDSSNLRRDMLLSSVPYGASLLFGGKPAFAAAADKAKLVEEARRQMDPIPKLIDNQKWDSVRAILITPPLSECWTKSASMLRAYAESVDDELAALEAKEEAVTHLRFLDMAVYNNVFNPIATEGTAGATKELVRSYCTYC